MKKSSIDFPKTIEDLKRWYIYQNLPSEEVTRFFIGKDIKEPKAFGIYQNEYGEFIVYKNKFNGERIIRYSGHDEEYAVNELYQRLKLEIRNQNLSLKDATIQSSHSSPKLYNPIKENIIGSIVFGIIVILCLVIIFLPLLSTHDRPNSGYYKYNNRDLYYQNGIWYDYDNGWHKYKGNTKELDDNYNNYRITSDQLEKGTKNFENSNYFYDSQQYNNDSSWDSSITDWSSDW